MTPKRGAGLPLPSTPEPRLSPRRHSVAHAWLSAADYIELEREATARRMHPDALIATVASKISKKKLWGAIADH